MPLTLHFHPLASYCWKALIALYENGTPFDPHLVDLGDADGAARFKALWPVGKMPVLRDEARNRTVPEATIIIEYLQQFYPGPTVFIPADADRAWQTRLKDRVYDLYVHEPMQKIVGDKLRPDGGRDPHGVALARERLAAAYAMLDAQMGDSTWAMGDAFTLADCAAAPALYYANRVEPFPAHTRLAAYLERLMQRPSFARAVQEAEPYFKMFPG